MNALISVKTIDQDLGLGTAFDAALQGKQWDPVTHVPFSYTKSFKTDNNTATIEKVKEEIEAAAVEADWKEVKYLVLLSTEQPVTFTTK